MVKTRQKISLVIPAYNEQARIASSIGKLKKFFADSPYDFEAILVIEKSTDKTEQIARTAAAGVKQINIIANPVHRGKGYAVRTGIKHAKGDYVFFMDCDLSTGLDAVGKFMDYFKAHKDVNVLIASRAHPGSNIIIYQNPLRQNLGKIFNVFVRLMAIRDIKDTQCGFKAFRAPAAKEIFSRQVLDGFAFDVEVLLLARSQGYKAAALPVKWTNSVGSKVNLGASIRMLRDLFWLKYFNPKLKNRAKSSAVFVVENDL